jgi:tetratricopeptide (TPR) repeat protein
MENKKITMVMMTFFSIVAFVAVYLFINREGGDDKNVSNSDGDEKTLCNLSGDQEYFQAALAQGDMQQCQCIGDESIEQVCMTATEQSVLYQQAIAQVDDRICENLQLEEQRDACLNVVREKAEYLGKENKEQLSYTYLNNHNDEKAIAVLEEMISENQNDAKSLINISLAYANQVIYGSLNDEQKNNNINKALVSIKKAQELETNNPEAYRVEGFIYEAAEKLEEALDVYDLALQKFPKDILLLNGRGHAENMLGYIKGAIATFESATELDVNMQYAAPWMNLCRLQSGDSSLFEKSMENCQKVIDMKNANANYKSEALQIMAQILMVQNNFSQALDKLNYASILSPRNDNVYVALAKAYNGKEDGEMAEQMARKALEINNLKTVAHLELANALYVQKRHDDAINSISIGLGAIDKDVSLLLPSKSKIKMDLNYLASDIYAQKGDGESAQRHKSQGDEIAKTLNLNF